MNILLSGGTGFIGNRLIERLIESKHQVYVLTRSPQQHQDSQYVTYISYRYEMKRLPFIHAVINLAGESLFGYWTEKKKDSILTSRIDTTNKLMHMLMQMKQKPNVFISGSAIGIYGTDGTQIFTEETTKPSNDFLATVVTKWEEAAAVAEDLGVRTVYTRFGVVLDENGGALHQMAKPFKLFAGGKMGTGKQWMSWIHLEDCVRLIQHALYNERITGPLNITAPYPARNANFSSTLAHILNRPNCFTVPKPLLTTVLGEMATLVVDGQFVYPKKALNTGFVFKYPYLHSALENIYTS